MGRRSINTTKSGKYMNPTDQARKEARKKELKKNKRQRQMVRAAVLKNKDPAQILEEMEKIDEMEYNVLQPSPLNEKVLRDKRKKLKDTFDRVMRLYHNDEPDHWSELKRKEVEYEKKRLKKQQYYESVKHAQSVQIDEIPLPSSTQAPPSNNISMGSGIVFPPTKGLPPPPSALSLPSFAPSAPQGALKTSEMNQTQANNANSNAIKRADILGVPPGPPPELLDMSDLDTDAEDDEVVLKEYNPKKVKKIIPKPNSLQQRMLAISGQNIDDFMKEMESVHKKKQGDIKRGDGDLDSDNEASDKARRQDDYSSDESTDDEDDDSLDGRKRRRRSNSSVSPVRPAKASENKAPLGAPTIPPPMHPHMHNTFPHMNAVAPPAVPTPVVGGLGPPTLMYRPPPLRPPAFGMRMPLGPPGSRPPNMVNMTPRMGVRMPPGPPPGLPPRMQHHHKNMPKDVASKGVTTITAKPQIRNLSADVTRFVPSTLRVRREEIRKPNRSKALFATEVKTQQVADANKAATKDDAYLQFMNEMQGLL